MVTSSFAFYPGLPIHRSVDLQTWDVVGHALIGPSWLPMDDVGVSFGIWAATIRHGRGRFFIVFTVAGDGAPAGLYVTTAVDVAGPWTPPRLLEGDGIDPSLFFDDDGRAYLTAARDCSCGRGEGPGEIWLREFDPASLSLKGATRVLWHGAMSGAWVEAPHIHKRSGRYHLIAAEGGTERNHAVTSAIADRVVGPYRTDPRSPLLTHRHLGQRESLHNVGHADLVDTPDGRSFAALLAVRTVDGHHVLGRETFIIPVDWAASGPVFSADSLRPPLTAAATPAPPPEWMSLRGPAFAEPIAGGWRVASRPEPLAGPGVPGFIGIRQDHAQFSLTATIDTGELGNSQAGVIATQSGEATLALTVDSSTARATWTAGSTITLLGECGIDGFVRLSVQGTEQEYTVFIDSGGRRRSLGTVPAMSLSTESVGGFVGVTLGLVNVGEADGRWVTFTDVDYSRSTPTPSVRASARSDDDRMTCELVPLT